MTRRPRKRDARRPAGTRPGESRPLLPPRRRLDNLPAQLSTFIGREQEIAEIGRLLGSSRLLTLTGSGGCGKTRLALRVAAQRLEQYPDGVWLVELAPLSEPALVPKAVASALRLPDQPGRPLTDTVADYLRTKNALLLWDNCEHLLRACQGLTETLLQESAGVRVLATSREALGVEGEATYRVPSLRLPDTRRVLPAAHLAGYDGIRLFTERAALCRPGFALTEGNAPAIVQICHRLDGMPLAIEFAAARVTVLSVEQIAARLDDRFRLLTGGARKSLPRQQTLRATLDWSYDLLSEDERTLLRRLSVFAGGWTLEAAEAVCGRDGLAASDILNLLARLVEKSLVVVETHNAEARYHLLETVRQYTQEKLIDEGTAAQVRRAHRDWYLTLAEQAAPQLHGPLAESWLARLETEHDNLRAALEWSGGEPDGAEAGLRLVGALHLFWFRHDHWSDGMRWTEGALARSSEAPPAAVARALVPATDFAWRRGDYQLAKAYGEKGLALCRQSGDEDAKGFLLCYLGISSMRQADYGQAAALFDDCVRAARATGNRWLYAVTLVQLGILAWFQGDDERATAFHIQTVAIFREVGDKWGIAYALHRFGRDVALQHRHYDQATAFFRESLILCGEATNRWISGECLEGLARVASAKGRCEHAGRLFGAAEAQREIVGHRFAPPDQDSHNHSVTSARAAAGDAAFTTAWAEGRAMTLEQSVEYAMATAGALVAGDSTKTRDQATGRRGPLAPREREVAVLVAQGLSNRDIAARLVISERTAETHVQHILNKLGCSSRAQIATWATQHGLLPKFST